MNSHQAKQIPLTKILEQLGYSPHHEARGDVWYFSPFRKESEASFKIDTRQNVWFDYGEGAGGNGLDLINYLHYGRKCADGSDVSFVLGKLTELTGEYSERRDYQTPDLFSRPASTGSPQKSESTLEVVRVRELRNEALTGYLRERGISLATAHPYVKEIYYKYGGKNYFALCFANDSGGYELRNKYFKGVHGSKDISVIGRKNFANEKKIDGEQAVTVFEGFMDFLSALEYHGKPVTTPVIVLNSVAMKDRTVEAIKGMEASKVYLYLDNDVAGRELSGYFQQQLQDVAIIDNSDLYAEHKDFNEFLVSGKKQAKSL